MNKFWRGTAATGLGLVLAVTAACTASKKDTATSPSPTAPQQSSAASASPAPSGAANSGKYNPPIELTTVRMVQPNQHFDAGENIDRNAIYDYYLEKLGIKVVNKWTVTGEYNSKVKIAIAANDLPDFLKVSDADLQELVNNNMVMDLTQLWDKYASEDTKREFNYDGGKQIKSGTFNGKMMAIPETRNPYSKTMFVWVRKDWLKELNLPEPKSINDLIAISDAFSKRDTKGKGKAYGLFLDKDLADYKGFFNSFHAYPGIWVKDASGKLTYGSLDPQMKAALKQLQDMFKAGQIDPEFGVKDFDKAAELIASDRIGLMYGTFANSLSLAAGAVKDGKILQDWEAYMIPSIDDKPALNPALPTVKTYYVVNKNAKHPEAVIKLLNEWTASAVKSTEENSILLLGKARKPSDFSYYEINPIFVFSQYANVLSGELIPQALKTGDRSVLGTDLDRNIRYDSVLEFKKGNITESSWVQNLIAKEDGTLAKLNAIYKNKLFMYNEFYGAATPTMGEKMSILDAKEYEMITKIIMGSASVDKYDDFVKEWKSLGGDKITQEVNDWYQKMK